MVALHFGGGEVNAFLVGRGGARRGEEQTEVALSGGRG